MGVKSSPNKFELFFEGATRGLESIRARRESREFTLLKNVPLIKPIPQHFIQIAYNVGDFAFEGLVRKFSKLVFRNLTERSASKEIRISASF